MWYVVALIVFGFLYMASVVFRLIVNHPMLSIFYAVKDSFNYIRYKKWRILKTGYIYLYVGLFGKGKTLSAVHYVRMCYKKYNNVKVYIEGQGWVTQQVRILSNVKMTDTPYIMLTSLQQLVDMTKCQHEYDIENGVYTVNLALIDELSSLLNSRDFKTNISPAFLSSLLQSRKSHTTIVGCSQRAGFVDLLFRQIVTEIRDCNKILRFVTYTAYDPWDYENASNKTMVRPLGRGGFFCRDSDFAYDTNEIVSQLDKATQNKAMLTEQEILALQMPQMASDDRIVHKRSNFFKRGGKKNVAR